MHEMDSQNPPPSVVAGPPGLLDFAGGKNALAAASQHRDILFVSLTGVACIVVLLLAVLAFPVFGISAISSLWLFGGLVLAALAGLGIINWSAHRRVTIQALLTQVLLNSLGEAYFSFNVEGACGKAYSQACLDLLECAPADKNILDVLRLKDEQRNDFKDWLDILFTPHHALEFQDVVRFLPQTFEHSDKKRHITLVYRPVRTNDGRLLSIVVIATDQTEEAEAEARAKAQKNFAAMISRIFKERNQFLVTVTHFRKLVAKSKLPFFSGEQATILRSLHTLKAAAKHFNLDELAGAIHKLETELHGLEHTLEQEFQERFKKGGDDIEAGLAAVFAQITDLIGQDFEGRGHLREIDEDVIYHFANTMRKRNADPELIRDYLVSIAAIPINDAFKQFERELRDLAEIMGKKVKPIQYLGRNPPILMQPMEGFFLALMHICRNIIDHGIEPAVTRMARGKDPAGLVTVRTDLIDAPAGGKKLLQIVIADDGNGIDPVLLRNKLAELDPGGAWQQDDDEAVIQRILLWQVSTCDYITDLSGHGVGMEAVEREVRLLGGTIKVHSELYKGTSFDIRVPYVLDLLARTPAALQRA